MEQNQKGVIDLLSKIAEDNEAQNKYLRKQLRFTRIFAISCCVLTIAMLLVFGRVIPPLLNTLEVATTALNDASDTLEQASETLSMLDTALLDVQGLFAEDGLVGLSSTALREATDKISRMDIESLNEAIRDLGAIVEPMANFFGKLKK